MSFAQLDPLLRRAVLLFGILILVMIVFVAKLSELRDPNAADYAQVARNLVCAARGTRPRS
jgi:hypothetical protein